MRLASRWHPQHQRPARIDSLRSRREQSFLIQLIDVHNVGRCEDIEGRPVLDLHSEVRSGTEAVDHGEPGLRLKPRCNFREDVSEIRGGRHCQRACGLVLLPEQAAAKQSEKKETDKMEHRYCSSYRAAVANGRVTLKWNFRPMGRIYTRDELLVLRDNWRKQGKTVVFTNGCYDILHPGHVQLLDQARALGDVLVVALNSDASVHRSKGPSRPIVPENDRATVVAALAAVDAVTLFDEETPRDLIAALLPDVLVKGADWSHFVAGREEVEAAGGRVLTLPLQPGYSTTAIIERIRRNP